MKKMLFVFLCLSLFHSQRAHSQQITAENVLEIPTPETIQAVIQEIDTLSEEELTNVLNKMLDQLSIKNKALIGRRAGPSTVTLKEYAFICVVCITTVIIIELYNRLCGAKKT